jgi:alpha-L-fucosidase
MADKYQPTRDSLRTHVTPQWEYYVKTYRGPETFGWKDFIPMFTTEKSDPDEWAEALAGSGARYVGPVGEHHDGFTMWDTQFNDTFSRL